MLVGEPAEDLGRALDDAIAQVGAGQSLTIEREEDGTLVVWHLDEIGTGTEIPETQTLSEELNDLRKWRASVS
jgi:hypothetical protein